MTDDPTTTGAREPGILINGQKPQSIPEMSRLLRGIPGANVTEVWPFTVDWKCDLTYIVADDALIIKLEIKDKGGEEVYQAVEFPPVPVREFGSPEALNVFLAELKRNFGGHLRHVLAAEAAEHLADVNNYLAGMMGVAALDKPTLAKRHADATAARVWEMLEGLPEKQKPGGWSKIALRNAVAVAAFRLTQRGVTGRALTLDAVNEEMRAEYGEQAAASGGALRKRLEERGLNWRPIKAEVERHAKAEAGRRSSAPLSEVPSPAETGG